MRAAAIQLNSTEDKRRNLERAERLVRAAAADAATLAVLPEKFNVLGGPDDLRGGAEPIPGPTTDWAAGLARELGLWLVAGSIVERRPGEEKLGNTSVLAGPDGERRAVNLEKVIALAARFEKDGGRAAELARHLRAQARRERIDAGLTGSDGAGGAGQVEERQRSAADLRGGVDHLGSTAAGLEQRLHPLRAAPELALPRGEHAKDGDLGARPLRIAVEAQRGNQCGKRELVDADGARERMIPAPLDRIRPAYEHAGLRAAEQLVAGEADDGRPRGDRVIGMAAAQFDVVHSFATYDRRVDTVALPPDEAVAALLD